MTGFKISTEDNRIIRFSYYLEAAPLTAASFDQLLPFARTFFHARFSGQEIWINDMPPLDIMQENASVYTEPGEVVLGPMKPTRTKTANCLGIYYGEGKGVDAANIFARVFEEDWPLLQSLGDEIWRKGACPLSFLQME